MSDAIRHSIPLQPVYEITNETRGCVVATSVSIAGTSSARRRGLLGKHSLKPGGGLWIAPSEAVHTFAMRVAIDVVFLDRDKRVVKIVAALRPWRLAVCFRAHSVLELQAGCAADTGVRVGDRLRFKQVS